MQRYLVDISIEQRQKYTPCEMQITYETKEHNCVKVNVFPFYIVNHRNVSLYLSVRYNMLSYKKDNIENYQEIAYE